MWQVVKATGKGERLDGGVDLRVRTTTQPLCQLEDFAITSYDTYVPTY